MDPISPYSPLTRFYLLSGYGESSHLKTTAPHWTFCKVEFLENVFEWALDTQFHSIQAQNGRKARWWGSTQRILDSDREKSHEENIQLDSRRNSRFLAYGNKGIKKRDASLIDRDFLNSNSNVLEIARCSTTRRDIESWTTCYWRLWKHGSWGQVWAGLDDWWTLNECI